MLSVKNLVKIYKTKGGVEVRALDGVSVDFPETGMVFLLGRSGSGKSTLLNVSGGLDKPTSGEIIVKGKSSSEFSSADFDSYRNTFVGFVFQEYNILEEFTVEQNIALALQLQNKPASKEDVAKILEQVDLSGVEKRKPRTLSGGQRQRVAIARALIKDPKIIMADEPTGALDSNTGTQIFQTLKKLAKDRLVIVVSHDRAFAEEYADRIIELADGKIIQDISKTQVVVESSTENVTVVNDQTITVKDWDKVTETDLKAILKTMKKSGKETVITSCQENMPEIKRLSGVEENKVTNVFSKTEAIEKRDYSKEKTKFIKSSLPIKHALRMAFDGIKSKPIRLCFTVFLAVVAFVFFGVSSTLVMYNPNYSIANALAGSNYQSIVLNKAYEASFEQTTLNDETKEYVKVSNSVDLRAAFSKEELDKLNQNTQGLNFAGIIDLGAYTNDLDSVNGYSSMRFTLQNINVLAAYDDYYTVETILGFSDCGAQYLLDNGYSVIAGRYPETATEIAIPNYIYEVYAHSRNTNTQEDKFEFTDPSQILNRTIRISGMSFTVVGVYDVGEIPEKFDELLNTKTQLDDLSKSELIREFKDIVENSFHSLVFVSPDFYDMYKYKTIVIDSVSVSGLVVATSPVERPVEEDNANTTLYTPKSIWKNDFLLEAYDANGNKMDFAWPNELEAYLPISRVFTTVPEEFYTMLLINTEYKTKHAEFVELIKKQQSSYTTVPYEDSVRFYELLFPTYKDVMGEDFKLIDKLYTKNYKGETAELTIKGVYVFTNGAPDSPYSPLVSDEFRENNSILNKSSSSLISNFKSEYEPDPVSEKYGSVITATQNEIAQTYFMLESKSPIITYKMSNLVYKTTSEMASLVFGLKILFYIAGAVFGLFAALMLFNFIAVSISSKNKEIGILRAVGARKNDVFKIFILEALIITTICFVISAVLSGGLCTLINMYTFKNALKIILLEYSAINVAILFIISSIVSFAATILPVTKAANKSPVESIRSL